MDYAGCDRSSVSEARAEVRTEVRGALYPCDWHHDRDREPVRYKEAQENMQRIRFVLLVLVAAMLGALISMVDSSPGWDDTGVSAAMVLSASGLMGALHPQLA